jgi:hypothetical protein
MDLVERPVMSHAFLPWGSDILALARGSKSAWRGAMRVVEDVRAV